MAGHLGHAWHGSACESERSQRSVFSFQSLLRPETGSWILGRSPQGSPAEKFIEAIESFNTINEVHPSHRIESGPSQAESPPRLHSVAARLRNSIPSDGIY